MAIDDLAVPPALWFLWSRSVANALRARLRRLRDPRYLLGTVLAFGWFGFILWSNGMRWGQPPEKMRLPPEMLFNPAVGSLVFLVALLAFAWLLPASRAAIGFSEAETAWLFPAPLLRQQLVRYKLLASQISLLFTSVLFALLTGRLGGGAGVGGSGWARVIGFWLILSLVQLHRIGASFVLARLYEAGLSDGRRRLTVAGLLLAVAGAFAAAWSWGWLPAPPDLGPLPALVAPGAIGAWLDQLREWTLAPPLGWLLWPLRAVLAPWFARDAATFLAALGPAFGILALHYAWVTRSDVAFEEASADRAQRDAERMRRVNEGGGGYRPPWRREGLRPAQALWRLRPVGHPTAAFAWRAALEAGGRRRLLGLLGAGAALLGVIAIGGPTVLGELPRILLMMLAFQGAIVTLLFIAPFATAKRVGGELRHSAEFKSAPILGRDVIRGRLWFSAVGWTLVQLVSLAVIVLLLRVVRPGTWSQVAAIVPAGLGAAAVILWPANAVAALLPSAAFLWFPAWFRTGERRGPEASGVGILLFITQVLWLLLALGIPGAVGAFAGWLLVAKIGLSAAVLLGALVAVVPLALLAWFGASLLGQIFDDHDPSRE